MMTIIAGIIALIAAIAFIWWSKSGKSPKEEANAKWGLPADWEPTEYLGPDRPSVSTKTPNGIFVSTNGFDREDIPLTKEGAKARVVLQDIDNIWERVKANMQDKKYNRKGLYLNDTQRAKILQAPYTLPSVKIWSTIQWSGPNNCYVGGLTINYTQACSVVWYKSVKNGNIINWEGILDWEFQNVLLLYAGRGDMAY